MLVAGDGLYVRCPVFLSVHGRPVVWLTEDEDGAKMLNMDVWDANGQLAFSMRDNDWVAIGIKRNSKMGAGARATASSGLATGGRWREVALTPARTRASRARRTRRGIPRLR